MPGASALTDFGGGALFPSTCCRRCFSVMGDIAGDISSKRGQISGTDSGGPGTVAIRAQVPLAELSNYQARLKSVTAGQGSFSVELSHYDPVPPNVQKDLAALHSKTAQVEEE